MVYIAKKNKLKVEWNMDENIEIKKIEFSTTECGSLLAWVDYIEKGIEVTIAGTFKNKWWTDCSHNQSGDEKCPFCHKHHYHSWLTCQTKVQDKIEVFEKLLKKVPYEEHEKKIANIQHTDKENYLAYLTELKNQEKKPLAILDHWSWGKTTDSDYLAFYVDVAFTTPKKDIKFKKEYSIPVRYYFFENRFEILPTLWIQFFTERVEYEATKEEKEQILEYVETIFAKENPLTIGQPVYLAEELYYEVWEGTVKETEFGVPYIEYTNGKFGFLFKKEDFYFEKAEAELKLYEYIKPEYEELSQGDEWIKYLFGQWVHYNAGKDKRFSNKRRAIIELIKERTGIDVDKKENKDREEEK